jgi:hypothetical protein
MGGQIFIFDYDYSQSPPTGDRQEQTPTRLSLLVCQSLLRRTAMSDARNTLGESSDDHEFHFFAMQCFEKFLTSESVKGSFT